MTREKRIANIQGLVFPSTKEKMKRRVRQIGPNVTSISDYLFLLVEKDLRDAEHMDIVNQTIGGRAGRN